MNTVSVYQTANTLYEFADITIRGVVLEDTSLSPWPWPRSLQVLKNVLSSARGQHYFLIR